MSEDQDIVNVQTKKGTTITLDNFKKSKRPYQSMSMDKFMGLIRQDFNFSGNDSLESEEPKVEVPGYDKEELIHEIELLKKGLKLR